MLINWKRNVSSIFINFSTNILCVPPPQTLIPLLAEVVELQNRYSDQPSIRVNEKRACEFVKQNVYYKLYLEFDHSFSFQQCYHMFFSSLIGKNCGLILHDSWLTRARFLWWYPGYVQQVHLLGLVVMYCWSSSPLYKHNVSEVGCHINTASVRRIRQSFHNASIFIIISYTVSNSMLYKRTITFITKSIQIRSFYCELSSIVFV